MFTRVNLSKNGSLDATYSADLHGNTSNLGWNQPKYRSHAGAQTRNVFRLSRAIAQAAIRAVVLLLLYVAARKWRAR